MRHILNIALLLLFSTTIFANNATQQGANDLQQKLSDAARTFPGEVGIALISGDDMVTVNGNTHFPMFSVVKFHQALAVCDVMRKRRIPLQHTIDIRPEQLDGETWSPMLRDYPRGGSLSVSRLLTYTLEQSDNNACDVLFNEFASPRQVSDYVRSLGIAGCNIAWNEAEQHADINRTYDNWSTPVSAARLMNLFCAKRNFDNYYDFLWHTMAGCKTGGNRIPKYISAQASTIIHKTGTGASLRNGRCMGICDVACIMLRDGSHFELAVFIGNTSVSSTECEEFIARVAETAMKSLTAHATTSRHRSDNHSLYVATSEQIALIVDNLSKEDFDDRRYETAMLCVRLLPIPVEGLRLMAKTFSFDDRRLRFLKEAYSYCPDPEHYGALDDCFSFNQNAEELRRFVSSHRAR